MNYYVRKGFLVATVGVTSVIGSTLWAVVSSIPHWSPYNFDSSVPARALMPSVVRAQAPAQLAWFFIQYPYLSENARIERKNHHTFVVTDNLRRREYVVVCGQRFRRVEIYYVENKTRTQVRIYTPGQQRTVEFIGLAKVNEMRQRDDNYWMWQAPLWNDMNIRIYSMADFWKDSPFKRYSCAGFVHRFLSEAGVNVPVLDAWDINKQPWQQVSLDELEPGDIVTIRAASEAHRRYWKHSVTHVGVYLGQGKLIHAATSSPRASRSWVRVVDLKEFHSRIEKVLRPPELL